MKLGGGIGEVKNGGGGGGGIFRFNLRAMAGGGTGSGMGGGTGCGVEGNWTGEVGRLFPVLVPPTRGGAYAGTDGELGWRRLVLLLLLFTPLLMLDDEVREDESVDQVFQDC